MSQKTGWCRLPRRFSPRVLEFTLLGWTLSVTGISCDRPQELGSAEPLVIFGRTGYGPREFSYPRAIAISKEDIAYIVDKTGRIQAFDAELQLVADWKTPLIDAGKPTGLGVLANGNVAVADTHYSRVLEYRPDGTLVAMHGSYGEGPGQFHLPTDVASGVDGTIFVGEYGGNDRVSVFDATWKFLSEFGSMNDDQFQFARPQSLHAGTPGSLWICDARNHRVCRVSAHGKLLQSFGEMGTTVGRMRFPYGIDVLSDGSLVVAEYGNNRVQKFSADGVSQGVWGKAGRNPGELAYPWAVAVDSKDRVWIVDSGNNRIQIIDGMNAMNWHKN
ncbi:MAG: hypothetical protein AB7N71_14850 [Phycisphaerae bacterium]